MSNAPAHDLDEVIQVLNHPPERRRLGLGGPVQVGNCCCSCCCCCCLHSLGGLIGAATAPCVNSGSRQAKVHFQDRRAAPIWARLSAVGLFWWSLLAVVLLGTIATISYFALSQESASRNVFKAIGLGLEVTAFGIVMLLPALQLIAAMVTVLILATTPRPDKGQQFRLLRKIVVGMIIGSVVGLCIMLPLLLFFLN
jgi:hypothetical protein